MTDDLMRRLCIENPPAIVIREPRYQQETADVVTSWALEKFGVAEHQMPIWHLDGIPWHVAPPPPRRHQHWAQTVGQLRLFDETWRCPCGAIGDNHRGGGWVQLDTPRVAPKRSWWARWRGGK